eukprot:8266471-Pyramimonas_sp.AAC.1
MCIRDRFCSGCPKGPRKWGCADRGTRHGAEKAKKQKGAYQEQTSDTTHRQNIEMSWPAWTPNSALA